jgi:hypothetical protein
MRRIASAAAPKKWARFCIEIDFCLKGAGSDFPL